MGRLGITFQDVSNAIATILGAQKNPTVDAIREELGTGSRSTIARHLSDWKTQNGIKSTNDRGIPSELQNLIQSLWEKIQSDADKKIEAHQLQTDEEINDAKNRLTQTQQQNALLHADIQLLNEKLNEQISIASHLTNQLQQSKNEKIQCDERITSLETQNANHKSENERLHQLLKNTQNNLTHYQQVIEKKQQAQQMQLEKERSEYALKLTVLEKQRIKAQEEKSILETKYELLMDDHQIQKNNLNVFENEKSILQLKNCELEITNNHLNLQQTKFQNEINTIKALLKENEKQYQESAIQLAILKNENTALTKKHEVNDNKINRMQSDINNLLQENSALKQAIKENVV